jgi:hypothetical protein
MLLMSLGDSSRNPVLALGNLLSYDSGLWMRSAWSSLLFARCVNEGRFVLRIETALPPGREGRDRGLNLGVAGG